MLETHSTAEHSQRPEVTLDPEVGKGETDEPVIPHGADEVGTDGDQQGLIAKLKSSPLVRRITGYSAGSIIAVFTSELSFAAAWGALHASNDIANLVGFIGGAIPNYVLNRKWAWKDRDGRSRRSELIWYFSVAIISYLLSTVVTGWAEGWTKGWTHSHDVRVMLVAVAYLAVSGVMFVAKFVAYEKIVFKPRKEPDLRNPG